ncbi:MAG: RDD family protein [Polyangiaceae bacterium]
MLHNGGMLPLLRIASLMVDVAIVAAAGALALVPVLLSDVRGWGALGLAIYATSGGILLAFVVQSVLVVRGGRSVGQRLLRLRVVGAQGPATWPRLLLRLAAFYLMPAALVGGAYGLASMAEDRIEDWGSTHPDWQASYDDAVSKQDEANDRVNHTPYGTPEHDSAYSEGVRQNNRLADIMEQRESTRTAWLADHGDTLATQLAVLWALLNGVLLFTVGGPLHDRLLRTRVERGGA